MSFFIGYPPGSGVTAVNGISGALTLAAGSNITLTPSGNTITISSSGGSAAINGRFYASTTTVSSSLATIVWDTTDFDTNTAYSAGVYTIPSTGKYQVNTKLCINGSVGAAANITMQIQKNGTSVSEDIATNSTGSAHPTDVQISDIVNCTAGDTIRVQLSTTYGSPSIVSSNTRNYLSIAKVG